jgi:hypothetical protein
MKRNNDAIAKAVDRLADTLYSNDERDSNLECATIVDAIYKLARSINKLADVIGHKEAM